MKTPKDRVKTLSQQIFDLRQNIKEYEETHKKVLQPLFDLLEDHNKAVREARSILKTAKSGELDSMDMGAFKVTHSYTRGYDPEKVLDNDPTGDAFQIPGVVKAIDSKVLDAAIRDGRVSSDVRKAWYEEYKSRSVYGPKEIEFVID